MVEDSISDRRNSIRVKDSLPTEVKFINGEITRQYATIENIGKSGACISVNVDNAKVKNEAHLKVKLPGSLSFLEIPSVVVWKKEAQSGIICIGLKFSELPSDMQNHINSYIQSRIRSSSLKITKKIIFKRCPLNKLSEKERRNLMILSALRKRGPLAKAQLSQIADLNIGTITNYVEDYINAGIVFETGLDVSTGGRRPTLLELNAQYGICIGIDISNKKKGLAIVTCDIKGRIINKYVSTQGSRELKINTIIEHIHRMILSSNLSTFDILGVGIAVNGEDQNKLLDLTHTIEQKLNTPVLIENASCASLFAERIMSPGLDDSENVLYFSMYNSDCALVINGDICRINSRFSIKMSNGKSSLKDNCWEDKENCFLRPLPMYNANNIKTLPRDLGLRLSIVTNMLKPDLIVLGDVDDKEIIRDLIAEVRENMKNWLIDKQGKLPKIILEHIGKEAAALGAALLVSREIFIQV